MVSTMLVECIDQNDTSVRVEVPIGADGLPQEWIYLQDGQLAATGRRYRRYQRPPGARGDPWEYFPA